MAAGEGFEVPDVLFFRVIACLLGRIFSLIARLSVTFYPLILPCTIPFKGKIRETFSHSIHTNYSKIAAQRVLFHRFESQTLNISRLPSVQIFLHFKQRACMILPS